MFSIHGDLFRVINSKILFKCNPTTGRYLVEIKAENNHQIGSVRKKSETINFSLFDLQFQQQNKYRMHM